MGIEKLVAIAVGLVASAAGGLAFVALVVVTSRMYDRQNRLADERIRRAAARSRRVFAAVYGFDPKHPPPIPRSRRRR